MLEVLDDEEEDLPRDETPEEVFYLWDTKKDAFEIFSIIRAYLGPEYDPNPALIIKLAEKRNLDIEEVLSDIPIILNGYLTIMYPKKDTPANQSKEPVDGR